MSPVILLLPPPPYPIHPSWTATCFKHHDCLCLRVALVPLEVHEVRVELPRSALEDAAHELVAVDLVGCALQLLAAVDNKNPIGREPPDLVHLHGAPHVRALEDPPSGQH